jgi:hypothetical protein
MPGRTAVFVVSAVLAGAVGATLHLGADQSRAVRATRARTLVAPAAVTAPGVAHHFDNCTDMRQRWPHGVGRRHAVDHVAHPGGDKPVTDFHHSDKLYKANRGMDRDGDKIACEAH